MKRPFVYIFDARIKIIHPEFIEKVCKTLDGAGFNEQEKSVVKNILSEAELDLHALETA